MLGFYPAAATGTALTATHSGLDIAAPPVPRIGQSGEKVHRRKVEPVCIETIDRIRFSADIDPGRTIVQRILQVTSVKLAFCLPENLKMDIGVR